MTAWKTKGYTDRQNEIIEKMGALGYSNQEIADRLGRSRQAIEKHRRKLALREDEHGGRRAQGN